jgi:hypothetical protein
VAGFAGTSLDTLERTYVTIIPTITLRSMMHSPPGRQDG